MATRYRELRLPARLIEEGDLSEAQLETIVMAHDAHGRDLPGRFTIDDDQTKLTRADDDPNARAYRLGYFLGDGTGCGKPIHRVWVAGRGSGNKGSGVKDSVGQWSVQEFCERSASSTKQSNDHRLDYYAPKLSRMDFVSGMRFSELPICARQRGPTSSAVA